MLVMCNFMVSHQGYYEKSPGRSICFVSLCPETDGSVNMINTDHMCCDG